MVRSHDRQFGKELYILYPGDYHASKDDCVLGTVTGSCLVVCLYDTTRRIGGMGHFIVPGTVGTEGLYRDAIAAHGVANMEYILGEIVKLGGDRKYLKAKVIGAADLRNAGSVNGGLTVGMIRFIDEYFRSEKIPVVSEDLGGNYRRKIYFYPREGKAYRKVLMNNSESSEFSRMEQEYIDRELRNSEKFGKVILFE